MERVVECVFPFASEDANQLDLSAGDRIKVLSSSDQEWWVGRSEATDKVGAFPVAYCTETKEKPKFHVTLDQKTHDLQRHTDEGSGGGSSGFAQRGNTASRQMRQDLGLDDGIFGSGAGEHQRFDELKTARRQYKLLTSDVKRLKKKVTGVEAVGRETDAEIQLMEKQRDAAVEQIRSISAEYVDLEKRMAVIRAALNNEPLPEYKPVEAVGSSLPAVVEGEIAKRDHHGTVTPGVPDSDGGGPMSPAFSSFTTNPSTSPAEIPEPEFEDDKVKKLIKKFKKRMVECDVTRDEYAKQQRKIDKKLGKLEVAIQSQKTEQAARQTQLAKEKKQMDREHKAELEKFEADHHRKAAAVEEAEAHKAALEKEVSKAQKKIKKGQAASSELDEKLAELRDWVKNSGDEMSKQQKQEESAERRVAKAEAAIEQLRQDGVGQREAAVKAVEELHARCERDVQRIEEFKAQIATIKAAQAEA